MWGECVDKVVFDHSFFQNQKRIGLKGEFTVKSAYYIALSLVETEECGECLSGDQRTPLWRKIWHLKIPEKIRIFAW